MSSPPRALPSRRSLAIAWRLALAGVAVGVMLSTAVGRDGCLLHAADHGDTAASIDHAPAAPAHAVHVACAACAAANVGIGACPDAAAPVVAPATLAVTVRFTPPVPPSTAPPLDYAPKTSPPVA